MRRLIAASVTVLMMGLTVSAEPNENLVLWYTFDEGAGRVVKDRSGRGHDGAIHGAKFAKLGDGGVIEFDGVDDYVSCPLTPELSMKDAVTVEVWAKPAAYGAKETGILAQWPVFALRQG